jgi:hypothetical protein
VSNRVQIPPTPNKPLIFLEKVRGFSLGVDKLPKQWVGEALIGNISNWENSTTNWRLIGEAMAEETKARSQGDKPSEKLRHAVIYWAGESHIHHIESFLNALDQLGAPVLGREECMEGISTFVRAASPAVQLPWSIKRQAISDGLGL